MSEFVKSLSWSVKSFEALSKKELHDLLQLRVNIFVVEQDCPYPEIDGKDPECYHVMGKSQDDSMIAVARIAPAGIIYDEISIGRVVTRKSFRRKGLGVALMQHSILFCKENLEGKSIKIAAQKYLEKFYSDLGFKTISDVYLWDGIEHVDMRIMI